MSNDYFTSPSDAAAATLARSGQLNTLDAATDTAFGKLPGENDLKRGKTNYCVDTGTVNALIAPIPYPPTTYVDGMLVAIKPAFTNSGASTVNVSGLGVKTIVAPDGTALVAGALVANGFFDLRYNATIDKFVLANPATMYDGGAPYATLNGVETLANKTLTAPVINNPVMNGAVFSTEEPEAGSTAAATTEYVDKAVENAVASLDEVKADLASPTFTGSPRAPTQTASDNSTKIATTAYVDGAFAAKAPIADPTFTGTVSDPAGAMRDVPQNVQNNDYTFALTDRGKHVAKTDGVAHAYTIPANATVAFPIGTILTIVNPGGTANNLTITRAGSVALYRAGTDANVTVTPGDMVTVLKVGTNTWQA